MNTQSIPPSRSQRNLCWKLRDEYFECLENITPLINNTTNNKIIIDPILVQDDEETQKLVKKFNCWKKKEEYEKACITSWVSLLGRKRNILFTNIYCLFFYCKG
jgi:cytochrome c oxidase assembly factor 6